MTSNLKCQQKMEPVGRSGAPWIAVDAASWRNAEPANGSVSMGVSERKQPTEVEQNWLEIDPYLVFDAVGRVSNGPHFAHEIDREDE